MIGLLMIGLLMIGLLDTDINSPSSTPFISASDGGINTSEYAYD